MQSVTDLKDLASESIISFYHIRDLIASIHYGSVIPPAQAAADLR